MPSADRSDLPQLRYALEQMKLIATGGMAEIYRARQPQLERFVAIKRLKGALRAEPEPRERFRREARALATLLHQNIAHVYDFVEEDEDAYLLMEYIDGVDLSIVVDKLGALPPVFAAAVFLGVARGVDYIHAHRMIHRDIKPANIRLTVTGEVKLMDFGIAIDEENESLTRPGLMVGSPNYLSPEQVLGDPLTNRSDVFLLGIVLYEMLAGVRPFQASQGETIYQRIREAKFVPLREVRKTVPPELEAVVKRCLQRDPRKRYPSVKKAIADVEAFLGPEATAHASDVVLAYLDEEALLEPAIPYVNFEGKHRKNRWNALPAGRWPLLVVVAALLGLAAGYGLGRYRGEPTAVPEYAPPRPLAPTKAKAP
jgi:serine/threonine-protein kinase